MAESNTNITNPSGEIQMSAHTNQQRRWLRLLAALFTLALVAAACGSDDADDVVDGVTDAAE
ncbi:MAG: hypothetical protein AAFO29_11205, partial [Actinomycetota bacterium]